MTPGSMARTAYFVAEVGVINHEDVGRRAAARVIRLFAWTTSGSGSPDRCEVGVTVDLMCRDAMRRRWRVPVSACLATAPYTGAGLGKVTVELEVALRGG